MRVTPETAITEFREEYFFLSNFYRFPITWAGKLWSTVEHAFQAEKFTYAEQRKKIRAIPTPAGAKRQAHEWTSLQRKDWRQRNILTMRDLLRTKFVHPGSVLAIDLEQTGDRLLVEGNDWGDNFWGMVQPSWHQPYEGENWLGFLLMGVRAENRPLFQKPRVKVRKA